MGGAKRELNEPNFQHLFCVLDGAHNNEEYQGSEKRCSFKGHWETNDQKFE